MLQLIVIPLTLQAETSGDDMSDLFDEEEGYVYRVVFMRCHDDVPTELAKHNEVLHNSNI